MWIEPPIVDPVLIQIVGVENSKSPRREGANHPVRLYGHRVVDGAKRLVGVEVPCAVGSSVVSYFTEHGEFPTVEVGNKKWFFVGIIGKDEALFRQEG